MTIVVWLQLNILLYGELWSFSETPVPWAESLAALVQSREPFFGRVDELESTLLHNLLATTIDKLLSRRSQELVTDSGQQLLHIDALVHICQILDRRPYRWSSFAYNLSLKMRKQFLSVERSNSNKSDFSFIWVSFTSASDKRKKTFQPVHWPILK